MAYIEFRDVKKVYKTGSVDLFALNGADFIIDNKILSERFGKFKAVSFQQRRNRIYIAKIIIHTITTLLYLLYHIFLNTF